MVIQQEILQILHQSYTHLSHQKWYHYRLLQLIVYHHIHWYISIKVSNCPYLILYFFRYTKWSGFYNNFNRSNHGTFSDTCNRLLKQNKWYILLTTKRFSDFGRISNTKKCAINEAQCCTIRCFNWKSFIVSHLICLPLCQ